MCHNFYTCNFVNNIINYNIIKSTIFYFIDSITIEINSDDMIIDDQRAESRIQ